MILADVFLDIASRSLSRAFTYSVPSNLVDAKLKSQLYCSGDEDNEHLDGVARNKKVNHPKHLSVSVGCVVRVPFGRADQVGFVTDVYEGEGFSGVKPIAQVLLSSYLPKRAIECAKFLSKRYVAPFNTCIRLFLPPGSIPKLKQNDEGHYYVDAGNVGSVFDKWVTPGPNIDEFKPRANATRQVSVLSAVKHGDIPLRELKALYGDVSSAVNTLEKNGAVKIDLRRRIRGALDEGSSRISENPGNYAYGAVELERDLTDCQATALKEVLRAYSAHNGSVVVMDGVTGSGKTEVYLQAIAHVLSCGQSAIVLVPEISLTPQTVARFHARFAGEVALLHSQMSPGERLDQWDMIRSGASRVVVGARSALFAPVQNLGLIVIDEEHESTYKQESAPRYVARDVACWMASEVGGAVVLGSATPSIDTLYKASKLKNWSICKMPERANGRPLPDIEIIDMTSKESKRKSRKSGVYSSELLSTQLSNAVAFELEQNHKVVLLLNQRGFAQYMICDECGFAPRCVSCSTTLTYHLRGNKLMCHHCGYSIAAPPVCPSCQSPYFLKRGVGTQRAAEEVAALLRQQLADRVKDINIIRMDADSTSKKGAHRILLDQFASSKGAVLLGTQMIAKGLDFDDVTLVGVLDADTQLHLPDFRASERTFQLIEQVAGRAGRASLPGRVLVQSHNPDDIAIVAASRYDRNAFLRSELKNRLALKYPPYVRLANVLLWGANQQAVSDASKIAYNAIFKLRKHFGLMDWELLGPVPCVFERLRKNYRWHIVLKAPLGKDVSSFLSDALSGVKMPKGVNLAVDVDPNDLL